MGAIIDTPRAAKRMVNKYRLIRTSMATDSLNEFNESGYRTVQFLLGVLVGCPEQADQFFSALLRCKSSSVFSYLGSLDENYSSLIYVRQRVGKTWTKTYLDLLQTYQCKQWIPIVARYSFETAVTVFQSSDT